MKVFRSILILVLSTLLASCTNSEWLLSVFYNRMDNILATETKEYADFTPEQRQQIDLLADQYHEWHRATHLPRYASLLRGINTHLESGEPASRIQIEHWSAEIESYAREMADCYPLNNAFELMRSLSDEQVAQILVHGTEEYDEFVEEHVHRTDDKRVDKRYDQSRKWLNRVELDLNTGQRAALRQTIESERTLGGAGMELWKTWLEDFVVLLNGRDAEGFEPAVSAHIRSLWTLQDDNFPEIVEHNRELWIDYFVQLAQSQTDRQREEFSSWLIKMAANLDSIAANTDESIPQLAEAGACSASDFDYGLAGYLGKASRLSLVQDQLAFESENM